MQRADYRTYIDIPGVKAIDLIFGTNMEDSVKEAVFQVLEEFFNTENHAPPLTHDPLATRRASLVPLRKFSGDVRPVKKGGSPRGYLGHVLIWNYRS